MNEDRLTGAAKNLGGKVEEGVGRATGDLETQVRGKARQAEGQIEEFYGQAKETAANAAEAVRDTGQRGRGLPAHDHRAAPIHGCRCRPRHRIRDRPLRSPRLRFTPLGHTNSESGLERDCFRLSRNHALAFCLSMIFPTFPDHAPGRLLRFSATTSTTPIIPLSSWSTA